MLRLLMPGCALDRLDTPDLPAAAIIGQEPFGDRDIFGLGGRAAREREHEQAFFAPDSGLSAWLSPLRHRDGSIRNQPPARGGELGGVLHPVQAVVPRKREPAFTARSSRRTWFSEARPVFGAERKRLASRRASARGIAPTRARNRFPAMRSQRARSRGPLSCRDEGPSRGSGTETCFGGPARERALNPLASVGSNRRLRSPDVAVPTFCRKTVLPPLRVWRRLRPFRPEHPPFLPPQPGSPPRQQ